MRHQPLPVEIWAAFLILVGIGMLVFNKRYAAWATPLTPLQWMPLDQSAKLAVARVLAVVVGLVFVLGGASVFLPIVGQLFVLGGHR